MAGRAVRARAVAKRSCLARVVAGRAVQARVEITLALSSLLDTPSVRGR
jgi:hypothetical protein